jgi:hypothetical protein
LGTIWISSILQAILDHGDNPRFLVLLQFLVVLWVMWVACALLQKMLVINLKMDRSHIQNQSASKDNHPGKT